MFTRLTDSRERADKRGYSLPKQNKSKFTNPRPLILQKISSSPDKSSIGRLRDPYSNSKDKNFKQPGVKNFKRDEVHAGAANSFCIAANKAHRSPVPLIKASPLNAKDKSFVAQHSKLNTNNLGLSSSHLTKMRSAGSDSYGGASVSNKGNLQKFQLEKRISTSASSKVKSGESTCSSRNKAKMKQNTTDYVQLVNQRSAGANDRQVFYRPPHVQKARGNSTKVARDSSLRKSYQVDECLDEGPETSDDASRSSESDYDDSEEDKTVQDGEDNCSRVIRKEYSGSANANSRKYTHRPNSMTRNDSIPSMSRHVRRHKKIPGSVRKPTNNTVVLHQCPIQGGNDTIFFEYPPYVGKAKESKGKLVKYTQDEMTRCRLVLKIAESTHIYNSLVNSCKNAGFYLTDVGKDWNLLWTGGTKTDVLRYMNKFQKMNHFPGSYQLGRKDLMWKNISRLKRKFGTEYNICPKTYIFPQDYGRFIIEAKAKEASKNFYILKPVSSSCGNGIKVINASMELPKNKKGYLASKYLSKPHLIKGYKYDMRIYVLVTSYDPLVIYMYKDGLVRFSTEKFSLKPKNLKKRFIHLTNYSVNKKAAKYNKNKNSDENPCDDQQILSKWSYQQLKQKIIDLGYDWLQVEAEIKDVVIKAIISVEPYIVHQQSMYTRNKNNCFELYGFDIMFDYKLKPWLLEVNVSPSFSSSSPFDKSIKTRLI